MFINSKYQFYISCALKNNDDFSLSEYQSTYCNSSSPPPPLKDDYYYCHYMCYANPNEDNIDFRHFYLGMERNPRQNILNKYQPNSCVIYFILGGEGTFNGVRFSAGSFFYIKPYQKFHITGDWYAAWMVIDNNCAAKLLETLKSKTINQMATFYDIEGVEKFCSFHLYEFLHLHNSPRFFTSLLWQSLSFLDTDMPITHKYEVPLEAQIQNQILRSATYINDNLSTVTVSELAHITSYEVKYFSFLFDKVMGMPPKQYIISKKMDAAVFYLCNSNYSIEKITNILGYSHRNSFTSVFKKTYGVSPQKYRENHRKSKK